MQHCCSIYFYFLSQFKDQESFGEELQGFSGRNGAWNHNETIIDWLHMLGGFVIFKKLFAFGHLWSFAEFFAALVLIQTTLTLVFNCCIFALIACLLFYEMLRIFMQFARKWKQKTCGLFDGPSDHSRSVNHCKKKDRKMQQYLIHLTHKPSEPTKH